MERPPRDIKYTPLACLLMVIGIPVVVLLLIVHQWIIAGVIVVAFLLWNAYISNLGFKDRQALVQRQQKALADQAIARDEDRRRRGPAVSEASARPGKFGRNTSLAEAFLREIARLNTDQWRRVATAAMSDESWQDEALHAIVGPWAEANQRDSQAFVRHLAQAERTSVTKADLRQEQREAIIAATGTAGLAIFGREQISAAQFMELYKPFAEVIPLATIDRKV